MLLFRKSTWIIVKEKRKNTHEKSANNIWHFTDEEQTDKKVLQRAGGGAGSPTYQGTFTTIDTAAEIRPSYGSSLWNWSDQSGGLFDLYITLYTGVLNQRQFDK